MWNDTNFRRAANMAALFAFSTLVTLVTKPAAFADEVVLTPRLCLTAANSTQEEPLDLVTSAGVMTLSVEVARTPEQQQLGLMYRAHLAEDKGMLFPHDRPRVVQMWMRNTYISLDMVFIRADGVILRIEKMTEPFSERIISSNGEVTGVLEIAGGLADKLGLKAGDRVRHSHFSK